MKTTSYEISQKLAEIGFFAGSTIGYYKSNTGGSGRFNLGMANSEMELEFLAYDLETILEALPKTIDYHGEGRLRIALRDNDKIFYLGWCNGDEDWREHHYLPSSKRGESESLADMAARLLILLHEKGLVKFGGSND